MIRKVKKTKMKLKFVKKNESIICNKKIICKCRLISNVSLSLRPLLKLARKIFR